MKITTYGGPKDPFVRIVETREIMPNGLFLIRRRTIPKIPVEAVVIAMHSAVDVSDAV